MGWIYVEDEQQNKELGKPRVRLIGQDGNAFAIMGNVKKAMREYQKVDSTYNAEYMFKEYQFHAMSGDYDNLLNATMEFCEVY